MKYKGKACTYGSLEEIVALRRSAASFFRCSLRDLYFYGVYVDRAKRGKGRYRFMVQDPDGFFSKEIRDNALILKKIIKGVV